MSSDLHQEQAREPEPKKASRQILRHEILEGRDVLERPLARLTVSGLAAGLDIGFSLFLMAVMKTLAEDKLPDPVVAILVANMYAVGFVFVILGRSELFTEQTTLAVLPVLDGRASLRALARAWGVVYVANLAGTTAFAALAVLVGTSLRVIEPHVFGDIARTLTGPDGTAIFLSGLFAGWLMGLLSWLVAASRDTISQIVLVWLITTAIGGAHLHHVVVGTTEVLAGILARQGVTAWDFGHFLLWTTLGNVVGGSVFVALIKYGQAVPSAPAEAE